MPRGKRRHILQERVLEHAGENGSLQQIVWRDPDGRFPWQPGYTYPLDMQPPIGHP